MAPSYGSATGIIVYGIVWAPRELVFKALILIQYEMRSLFPVHFPQSREIYFHLKQKGFSGPVFIHKVWKLLCGTCTQYLFNANFLPSSRITPPENKYPGVGTGTEPVRIYLLDYEKLLLGGRGGKETMISSFPHQSHEPPPSTCPLILIHCAGVANWEDWIEEVKKQGTTTLLKTTTPVVSPSSSAVSCSDRIAKSEAKNCGKGTPSLAHAQWKERDYLRSRGSWWGFKKQTSFRQRRRAFCVRRMWSNHRVRYLLGCEVLCL